MIVLSETTKGSTQVHKNKDNPVEEIESKGGVCGKERD